MPSQKTGAVVETDLWELAYARFETPEQEIRKFMKRLTKMGALAWPRDAEIAELFCGRGNGLHALDRLGFQHVEGVDLSAALLAQYTGESACYVCDCRHLPFGSQSKDIVIIQGGLHHLPSLPDDLEQTLSEARRVLKDNGRIVVVEPWLTPFLSLVHGLCRQQAARHLSPKLDALATMIHYERRTYEQWLAQPQMILRVFDTYFSAEQSSIRLGKIMYVGHAKSLSCR